MAGGMAGGMILHANLNGKYVFICTEIKKNPVDSS